MSGLFEIIGFEKGAFEVRLNAGHAVFAGHFPGHPVLPGVCSLMIVRACAERLAGRELRYSNIQRSKFLAAITPESQIKVTVTLNDNQLEAVITDQNGTAMVKLKAEVL